MRYFRDGLRGRRSEGLRLEQMRRTGLVSCYRMLSSAQASAGMAASASPSWGRFYCQRVELPARSDRALMAPMPEQEKITFGECEPRVSAASWSIARIIGALT